LKGEHLQECIKNNLESVAVTTMYSSYKTLIPTKQLQSWWSDCHIYCSLHQSMRHKHGTSLEGAAV